MLQVLVQIIIVSFIFIAWGAPFVYFQSMKDKSSFRLNAGTLLTSFIAGICILAMVSSVICLFLPLKTSLLLSLTAALLLFEWWFFKKRISPLIPVTPQRNAGYPGINITENIFLVTVVIMIVSLASLRPIMEDLGLYHLQIIQWTHNYPVLPGIGNLYLRNGFFSNWLNLVSWTSPSIIQPMNYLAANAALSLFFCFFLFWRYKKMESLSQIKAGKGLQLFYACCLFFCLLEWDLLRAGANTTSYDFIVTVLSFIVMSFIAENMVFAAHKKSGYEYLIILLACSIPFFKLSGIFILPILLVYFRQSKKPIRYYIFAACILLIGAVPFLIKNYIQTGYPLYPYTFLQFGSPDWLVPEPLVNNISQIISLSNKRIHIFEHPHLVPTQYTLAWIPRWFDDQSFVDKIISIAFPVMVVVSVVYMTGNRKRILTKLFLLYITITALLLCWFYIAPDQRFVYAYFMFAIFLVPAFMVVNIARASWVRFFFISFSLLCVLYTVFKLKGSGISAGIVLQPQDINTPPYKRFDSSTGYYHIPEIVEGNWNPRCFDVPLPCIYHVNPYLEWRGTEIKKGFRMRAISDSNFIKSFNY